MDRDSVWLVKRLRRTDGKQAAVSALQTLRGFTLLELLLTVALMLLFAGAIILSFGSLTNQARLEEGAAHVETLFRYARAQAANSGRLVRIVFGAEARSDERLSATNTASSSATTNSGVQVLWEPNPVTAPGHFESLPGAELLVDQVNDLVTVQEVTAPGAVVGQVSSLEPDPLAAFSIAGDTDELALTGGCEPPRPALTCYPDGSSDSVQIVLAATGGEDQRRAVVKLWGLSGTSQFQLITSTTESPETSEDWDPFEDWEPSGPQPDP